MNQEKSLRRALWSGAGVKASSLTNLQLPSLTYMRGGWLKALAAQHPRIEQLSLITRNRRIILEDCKNPFQDFRNLKSLSLNLGYSNRDISHHKDRQSVGVMLDHTQITSLQLSGGFMFDTEANRAPGPELQLPSHVTTPNLIMALVHLRIDKVDFQRAEYLLYHCHRLETLHLDFITSATDNHFNVLSEEYPPLITSCEQMSPFLRSTTMGFGRVS